MTRELCVDTEQADGSMIEVRQLSMTTAAGCFLVGALGLMMNYLWPESSSLDGLLLAGVFYLLDGILS